MNALVQRLRAEIRFDRDAFAKRVAELGSVDLGPASGPAPHAQAAVALHYAYAVDLDAGRLDTLRRRLIAAAPRILAEIDALECHRERHGPIAQAQVHRSPAVAECQISALPPLR